MTPSDQAIPPDGAILVGLSQSGPPAKNHRSDPTVRKWGLRRGSREVALAVETIAPGLSRYSPKKRVSGKWKVKGKGVAHRVRFGGESGHGMAAPKLTSVTNHTSQGVGGGPRGRTRSHTSIMAELETTKPAAAHGLMLLGAGSVGDHAMLFRQVADDATYAVLYTTPSRCGLSPPGFPPAVGSKVQVAWVDRFGRVSDRSNIVTLEAKDGSAKLTVALENKPPPDAAPEPAKPEPKAPAPAPAKTASSDGGCGCTTGGRVGHAAFLPLLLLLAALARRRFD